MKTRSEKLQISAEMVLQELACTGFLDPRRLFNENGSLLPIQEMPESVVCAIASIDFQTVANGDGELITTVVRIKFNQKIEALGLIAKHLGMFASGKVVVQHEINNGMLEHLLERVENQSFIDTQFIEEKSQAVAST